MPDLSQIAGNASMAGQMGSAALQGGFGIVGSLVNYGLQKRLAAQQNEYNLEMWRLNNEYNSPQAQMQRFQEAGLNPNLIYGQGTAGNSSSAPQMVTPNAPEISREMQELGKAFNIENLRTVIANRKKAQADAENAKTDATRNARQLFAEEKFGNGWTYDYQKGQYVLRPELSPDEVRVVHPSAYYFNRILESNYNRSHLIPYRQALLEQQKAYLVPQVWMANYEKQKYPVSYWVGQGSKVLNSLTSIPATFSPLKWVPK